jgi:hypothetical protein
VLSSVDCGAPVCLVMMANIILTTAPEPTRHESRVAAGGGLGLLDTWIWVEMALGHFDLPRFGRGCSHYYPIGSFGVFSMHKTLAERDQSRIIAFMMALSMPQMLEQHKASPSLLVPRILSGSPCG